MFVLKNPDLELQAQNKNKLGVFYRNMLIAFHYVIVLISYLFKLNWRRRYPLILGDIYCSDDNYDAENSVTFDPPVYRQRYGKVFDLLLDERYRKAIKKLIDFGCAEFGLFVFVKRLIGLSNLLMIDIDEDLLKHNLRKVQPLTIEYLKRRDEPFNVSVLAGSVGDPDYRLLNADAVTAIELIEHLYPDVLEAFPYNVFSYIEPKIVIVTTPNADFNILFPNFKGIRHDDHKFEWSRQQFEDWANNLILRFPDYEVTFTGIGEGPVGTESYGCCTQMAVFLRKDVINVNYISNVYSETCICSVNSECQGSSTDCSCICSLCCPKASYGICTYYSYSKQIISYEIEEEHQRDESYNINYKLIEEIKYPFQKDHRTQEERIIDEFRYRINTFGSVTGRFYNYARDRSEIPLVDLNYASSDGIFITEAELGKVLMKFGYKVEDCIWPETGECKTCVIYEPDMEEYSSHSSDASGYESDYTRYHISDESFSDWDEPDFKKHKPLNAYQSDDKDMSSSDKKSSTSEDGAAADVDEKTNLKSTSQHDSGYQRSADRNISPQTSDDPDTFDKSNKNPKNIHYLKRAASSDCKAAGPHNAIVAVHSPDFSKMKIDIDKINELDTVCNQNQFYNFPSSRTFVSPLMKPHSEVFKKSPAQDQKDLPGPSNAKGKKRKLKKISSFESEEESALEDVKHITTCILENTLNKIDTEHNRKNHQVDIMKISNEEPMEETASTSVEKPSNCANSNAKAFNAVSDWETTNRTDQTKLDDNGEVLGTNYKISDGSGPADAHKLQQEVARASREALFDPNSQIDLLEDFEIPPILEAAHALASDIVLVGIQVASEHADADQNGFPNWLLQIFGTNVETEEVNESHDEPHFYCQGDGLGVHPSVMAVELDEDDQSSQSSNNNSTDFAEVGHGNSEQDMGSLTDQTNVTEALDSVIEVDNNVRQIASEAEEFFDTTDGSSISDNCTFHSPT